MCLLVRTELIRLIFLAPESQNIGCCAGVEIGVCDALENIAIRPRYVIACVLYILEDDARSVQLTRLQHSAIRSYSRTFKPRTLIRL